MFECEKCQKQFPKKSSFTDHVRRIHRENKFKCNHCQYETNFKYLLSRHIDKIHLKATLKGNCKQRTLPDNVCSLCKTFTAPIRKIMIQHYTEAHDLRLSTLTHKFKSVDEFQTWKSSLEKTENIQFYCPQGPKKRTTTITQYYRCFRDGHFASKGTGKRKLKMQGSNKINSVCPCSIKAVRDVKTGEVFATYITNHVGHTPELGRLNLTSQEKTKITEQLAAKVPFDIILDNIRESSSNSKYERIHLTTRKDLFNLKRQVKFSDASTLHTNGSTPHADDRTSVELWLKSVKNYSNIVRFYKPQCTPLKDHPELKDDDFVLVLAYDSQLEMLKTFGSDCVCFDGTHGTNNCGFELTTLLIKDDKKQGFPCAFMISNRVDTQIMTVFIQTIKKMLPEPINTNVLMSDISEVYYNAWCNIMPRPAHWLFCSWHVDRVWRNNLSKITDQKKRCYAYKLIRTLMDESDEHIFSSMLEKTMTLLLQDEDLKDFGTYFKMTYSNNAKSWACCYRKYCGINTNMILESTHKLLKYVYLNGKKVKTLDRSIAAILRLTRNKLNDKMISQSRGKLAPRIAAIRERHKKSLSMDCTIIPLQNSWMITSKSKTIVYEVIKTEANCDCIIKCDECNICEHEYHCSCFDAMNSNICKHIHRIVAFTREETTEDPENTTDFWGSINDGDLEISDEEDQVTMAVLEDLPSKNESIKGSRAGFEERKKEFLSHMVRIIEGLKNDDELDALKKINLSAPRAIEAIRAGLIFRPPATSQFSINPCARISAQKSLYSTEKRKRTDSTDKICKPTDLEKEGLFSDLLD